MEALLKFANSSPAADAGVRAGAAVLLGALSFMLVNGLANVLAPGYQRAFRAGVASKVLRDPARESVMMWGMLAHPAAAALTMLVAVQFAGLSITWPGAGHDVLLDAVALGSIVFLTGAFPGIVLDYTSFRIAAPIVPVWWVNALVTDVIAAFCVLYGRPGHGTAFALPNVLDLVA